MREGVEACHCLAIITLGELKKHAAGVFKFLRNFHERRAKREYAF